MDQLHLSSQHKKEKTQFYATYSGRQQRSKSSPNVIKGLSLALNEQPMDIDSGPATVPATEVQTLDAYPKKSLNLNFWLSLFFSRWLTNRALLGGNIWLVAMLRSYASPVQLSRPVHPGFHPGFHPDRLILKGSQVLRDSLPLIT